MKNFFSPMRSVVVIGALLIGTFVLSTGWAENTPQLEIEKNADMVAYQKEFSNNAAWIADKKKLGDLSISTKEQCENAWNILWPWAKKGNIFARYGIFSMQTMMHGPDMMLPGSTRDALSRFRDIKITGAYALRYRDEYPGTLIDQKYIASLMLDHIKEPNIRTCFEKDPTQACTQMAVKGGYLPSFQAFAEQVDIFIAAGKKPACRYDNPKRLDGDARYSIQERK